MGTVIHSKIFYLLLTKEIESFFCKAQLILFLGSLLLNFHFWGLDFLKIFIFLGNCY